MPFEYEAPLVNLTLADQAFRKIEAAIMRGELPPGAKISESALAKKLRISRGPLREAIHRLEGRKLVTRVPHVGPRVVSLSREDLLGIFEVREALEGMAARLAARTMTEEQVDQLEALVHRHELDWRLRTDGVFYHEAGNYDFHYQLVHGCGNPKLIELLCNDLYYVLRVYRHRSSTAQGRVKQAFAEHLAICQVIRARDGDLAERLMRQHVAKSRFNLVEQRQDDYAPERQVQNVL